MQKLIFLSLILSASALFSAEPLLYSGDFEDAAVTGMGCENIFFQRSYQVKFHSAGMTGTTAILHFQSGLENAFFEKLTFVGLLGSMGDIRAEKDLVRNGQFYHMIAEGIIDSHVLVVKVSVEKKANKDGPVICTSESQYSGFN